MTNQNHRFFFVANRGHHSDIGGLSPGSMPPSSTRLWEEGATFKSFKIVEDNVFCERELVEAFNAPAQYPGCTGSRNLSDNVSDLKAQIAANKKGIDLISQLIDEYGLNVVLSYMKHIQNTAEQSVRNLMKEIAHRDSSATQFSQFNAQEWMDNGTNLDIAIKVDKTNGNAVFDFSGTGLQVNGNLNTPRAITLSAIIYCIRCMLKHDIPLNQGCLSPIDVIIPDGSILWPDEDAAVVGGNVLTSQRIVDVIFKALNVCGASQGCMNNITFGNETGGYYETVGGGAGAGPTWNGRHGIHTHMTNTRITDVEILENRYPIMVNKFSLRTGSGGPGAFVGGDGLIRELIFRDELNLCVLTERRVFAPYGLEGASCGQKGRNTLITKQGRSINLGSKSQIKVFPGDMFRLETPGGGGYGPMGDALATDAKPDTARKQNLLTKGSLYNYDQIQTSA